MFAKVGGIRHAAIFAAAAAILQVISFLLVPQACWGP